MAGCLVLLSDEHQARALGCAGHSFVQTPYLDALAARGTRFTNAYTPSPICVPARASFATGLYPHQTRLWDNAMPYTGTPRSWGHVLQDKGVRVESIGKLHYRAPEDDVGFDALHSPMMVADGVGMVWASIRDAASRASPKQRMLGPNIGPGRSAYTDYDANVTQRAVEWLSQAGLNGQDWCLYVGLVAPHFPLVVPEAFYDLYRDTPMPKAKLHPKDGHVRHPWVEAQNAFMDSETRFTSPEERLTAMRSYYGLCSWLDHNVGQILKALEDAGLEDDTTVIYSSDHGDNVGARGLWGKSNHYEESVAIPMIMAGPGIPSGCCTTPVSLLDVSATIPAEFGAELTTPNTLRSLRDVIDGQNDPDRIVFSEYHAAGAVSGAFMLRKGRWKLIHYVGFAPELFDLEADPEELLDLSADAACAEVLQDLMAEIQKICDPEVVNAQAFADQADLIAFHGGREAALKLGAPGATPPPKVPS